MTTEGFNGNAPVAVVRPGDDLAVALAGREARVA